MSDRRVAGESLRQHQPLTHYLATGGRPEDHPFAEVLLAAAVCTGTVAEDDLAHAARRRLADPGLDDRSLSLWVLELSEEAGLARWWAAGFDPQEVAALRDTFPVLLDAMRRPLVLTVVEQEEPFTCSVTGHSWVGRAVRLDVRREPAPAPRFIAAHVVADLLDAWPGETHLYSDEDLPLSRSDHRWLVPRVVLPDGMASGLFDLAVMEADRPFTCPLTGRTWTGRALALLPPHDVDDITLLAAHVVADLLANHPGPTTPAPWPLHRMG